MALACQCCKCMLREFHRNSNNNGELWDIMKSLVWWNNKTRKLCIVYLCEKKAKQAYEYF